MILLTGASGLIGTQIAKLLTQKNEPFCVLARATSQLQTLKNIHPNLEIRIGDILDLGSLEDAFSNITQVIHCAAVVSFGDISAEQMQKINVEGTANMVNMALKHGIKRFCMLSSIAAIGRDAKNNITNEDTKWTESKLNSVYAKTKYEAELEVWRGIEEGLPAVMLCPSVVLGPGDWNNSSTKIFKNIYQGMRFYPSGTINIVDVCDVANAAYLTLKSNIVAQRYIIGGHKIAYKDFFTAIAIGFGKKAPTIEIKRNIALAGYYVLRLFIPWILQKKFINKETIVISSSNFNYDNSKFIAQFDYKYQPWQQTVAWVCGQLDTSK